MFLFRSLTIGLLAACVMLLVRVAPPRVVILTAAKPLAPLAAVGSSATIVDVAAGLSRDHVPALIRLAPGERVVMVNDRAVASDLEAGAVIAAHAPGRFVDLEVASDAGNRRRVLVVIH